MLALEERHEREGRGALSGLGVKPGVKALFTAGYARNAIGHNGKLDKGVQLISNSLSTILPPSFARFFPKRVIREGVAKNFSISLSYAKRMRPID